MVAGRWNQMDISSGAGDVHHHTFLVQVLGCFFRFCVASADGFFGTGTLRQTNIAMENEPFEDVFPIENGDIPLLC